MLPEGAGLSPVGSGSSGGPPLAGNAPRAPSAAGSGQVKALLVVNNTYGANYNLLRDVMNLYGWQTAVVGVTPTSPSASTAGRSLSTCL